MPPPEPAEAAKPAMDYHMTSETAPMCGVSTHSVVPLRDSPSSGGRVRPEAHLVPNPVSVVEEGQEPNLQRNQRRHIRPAAWRRDMLHDELGYCKPRE